MFLMYHLLYLQEKLKTNTFIDFFFFFVPKKRSGYYRNLGSLRAGTRHHGEFLRYGNAIQSCRERGYGQPAPRGSIPTNNGARRTGSQLIGGDKPMSAHTPGLLNLHIWQVITWAALRAGQNTFSNISIGAV